MDTLFNKKTSYVCIIMLLLIVCGVTDAARYIGYPALQPDHPPCNPNNPHERGCNIPVPKNPYTRGCNPYAHCRGGDTP
ncbi:UNVERIFIED_CONTAM: hypothetical protein ITH96_25285, partial [Salmonella enterica subsp. enterica serovar Weltevreden]